MEMSQMLERLLAGQEQMMAKMKDEMLAIMDASTKATQEMRAGHEQKYWEW
jgi:hypothetical protein